VTTIKKHKKRFFTSMIIT